MIEQKGTREAIGLMTKVSGEAAATVAESVKMGSILASSLLKQRTKWPQGGSDSFWGKLSPTEGPYLRGRSGSTSSRISAGDVIKKTIGNLTTYEAVVGSPDKHVLFHEEGGTMPYPGQLLSPAGYMRIATAAAQFESGADRYGDRSISDIEGSFLFRSQAGLLWAAVREGGELVLLYLLVKKSGPHRERKIFETTAKDVEPKIIASAQARVEKVINGR